MKPEQAHIAIFTLAALAAFVAAGLWLAAAHPPLTIPSPPTGLGCPPYTPPALETHPVCRPSPHTLEELDR